LRFERSGFAQWTTLATKQTTTQLLLAILPAMSAVLAVMGIAFKYVVEPASNKCSNKSLADLKSAEVDDVEMAAVDGKQGPPPPPPPMLPAPPAPTVGGDDDDQRRTIATLQGEVQALKAQSQQQVEALQLRMEQQQLRAEEQAAEMAAELAELRTLLRQRLP